MAKEPHSLSLSDATAEVVLPDSPADHVEKVSRYLESSVGESNRDHSYGEPVETDSDSGDSLFITQKPAPEALRSTRRRRSNCRSPRSSPRCQEESEGDASFSDEEDASSSDEVHETRKGRVQNVKLPHYSFPFLSGKKGRPGGPLLKSQHRALHTCVMGGFFKCVTQMWHGYGRKKWMETLPTLDVEGEDISPLSEAEEGRSEDEDIRVVENKCFVKPLKSKSRQNWCNDFNQEGRSKAGIAGQETSQGGRSERIKETPVQPSTSGAEAFSLDAQSSDDSCGVLADRQRNKESSRTDRNYLAQKETLPNPSRKRALCEQEAREEKLYGRGDSSVCELDEVQRIPRQCSRLDQEVREEQPEPQMKHLNVAKPLTDEVNAKVEKKISNKESFVVIEDCGVMEVTKPTPNLLPMSTEQFEEIGNGLENTSASEETFELSCGKIKGQKTKKPSSATDVTRDGEEHVDVGLSEDAGILEETSGTPQKKKKKKKKKKKQRRGEDDEKSSRAVEPLNDDGAEIKKNKDGEALVFGEECEQKKRSNKTSNLAPHSAEDFEELGNGLSVLTETLGLSGVRRKKHKKKHQSSPTEDSQGMEEGVDVGFCHHAVALKEETEKPQKKKRNGEDLLQHSTATDHLNDEAGTQTKKKKRKKEKAADVGAECGDNETSKILSDLPLVSTEQFEEPGKCVEKSAATEILEISYVKRRKHKKR